MVSLKSYIVKFTIRPPILTRFRYILLNPILSKSRLGWEIPIYYQKNFQPKTFPHWFFYNNGSRSLQKPNQLINKIFFNFSFCIIPVTYS